MKRIKYYMVIRPFFYFFEDSLINKRRIRIKLI